MAPHSQKILTSSWLCVAQPGRVREPTADRGRSLSQRCAGIQCSSRSWRKKKDQFSLRNYPQLESLSCTSISLDSPSTLLWMTSFSACLSRRSVSLDRSLSLSLSLSLSPTSARCHSFGTHSLSDPLLLSSIFFSLSFILKRVKQRRAFVQSTHELQPLWIDHKLCSLKADAIDKTTGKASTGPEKQANFLEDFRPFSRKTSTLEKAESYCDNSRPRKSRHDRARKKRWAVAGRFDTDDRRRHLHACMHAYRRDVFFSARLLKPL